MFGKRFLYAVPCLLVTACLTGCGSGGDTGTVNRGGGTSPTVGEVLEAGMAKADSEAAVSAAGSAVSEVSVSGAESAGGAEVTSAASEASVSGAEPAGSAVVTSADSQASVSAAGPAESAVLPSAGSEANAPAAEAAVQTGAAALPSYSAADIDVDLTAISGTMVYSEVNNMINDPESYLGKVVKMSGPIAIYHSEPTDMYYYACIISDATACCAQGIEFELADGNYPQEGEVTVTGVFDTYEEDGYMYITLRNSVLV